MDWTTYVNSLKKITIQDIATIIKDDLNKQEEVSSYGFKLQRNIVFFGKCNNGLIINPYLLIYNEEDNLCKELYDMLQNEFPNVFQYSYIHYLHGEYDYIATTNNLWIRFPNLCSEDQKWIFNQVHNDRENESKTRKLI